MPQASEDDDDDCVAPAQPARQPAALSQWTLHACYSPSYREPALYFEARDPCGAPLPLESVSKRLRLENGAAEGAAAAAAPRPAVTQEDHPVLHRPFYLLHPCQTRSVMALLRGEPAADSGGEAAASGQRQGEEEAAAEAEGLHYLAAWLCVVSQPLGLSPSPAEWRALLKEDFFQTAQAPP